LYTKPELEADNVPKNKTLAAEPQITEIEARSEIRHGTEEAISWPEPEKNASSPPRTVVAKDQEPLPRPAASPGAVSTSDEPLARGMPKDIAMWDSGAANEEENEQELQQKIRRTKEERERLSRIDELSRFQARLEAKLAAKKRKEGDEGVPPI
jgi:hypothetical protein